MIRTQVKLYFTILSILIILLFISSWSIYLQENEITQLKKNRFDFYSLIINLEQYDTDFNYIINRHIVNDNEQHTEVLSELIGIDSFDKLTEIKLSIMQKLGYIKSEKVISDAKKQQLTQFIQNLNFSDNMRKDIGKVQYFSSEILKMNIEALNAYHGYEKDETGGYTQSIQPNKQKAIDILYSQKYHILNTELKLTMNRLEEYVETLMYEQIEGKNKRQDVYQRIDVLLLSMIGLMILTGIYYSIFYIVKPLGKLIEWTKQVEEGNYSFDKNTTVKSEIGILMHSFDSMAEKIKEDIELLEKASLTDQLTQLYNRRALDNKLEELFNNFERYKTVFSVIIIDIDHFKQVNDTHGHDVGDSVLKEFAKILRQSIRKTDVVGRWGGEEFLIICPETNCAGARIEAEKIRKNIEKYNFNVVGKKTASLGTAEIEEGMLLSQVIEKADSALYEAKESGRNKVV